MSVHSLKFKIQINTQNKLQTGNSSEIIDELGYSMGEIMESYRAKEIKNMNVMTWKAGKKVPTQMK